MMMTRVGSFVAFMACLVAQPATAFQGLNLRHRGLVSVPSSTTSTKAVRTRPGQLYAMASGAKKVRGNWYGWGILIKYEE